MTETIEKKLAGYYPHEDTYCYPDIILCALLNVPVNRKETTRCTQITWGTLETTGQVMIEVLLQNRNVN